MGCDFFKRMNLAQVLKITAISEVAFWILSGTITLLVFFKVQQDDSILKDLKSKYQSQKLIGKQTESKKAPQIEYNEMIQKLEFLTDCAVTTAACLLVTQFILYVGIYRKNRCLILTWILLSAVIGGVRIFIIVRFAERLFLKLENLFWLVRVFFFYLAARFILEITNERVGMEEVEPPHFRPQSEDPREFREGLNYPSYPRSLQFMDRMAGMNKSEHAHPKRWVPTYDAADAEGRMVVVVDDPVYEAL